MFFELFLLGNNKTEAEKQLVNSRTILNKSLKQKGINFELCCTSRKSILEGEFEHITPKGIVEWSGLDNIVKRWGVISDIKRI